MEERKNTNTYKLAILVAFVTFILTFVGVSNYYSNSGKTDVSKKILSTNSLSNKLDQYKKYIDQYYLGEVDESKLEEFAIKGYFEGLEDPYTEYISKDDMKDYLETTNGNFVGIGIYMVKDTDTNKIMILSPIKGSPAEEAGLLPGDLILKVDGVEYSGDDMTIAANKIKGKEETKVTLEIYRDGEIKQIELERRTIKINPVEGKKLNNNIGYISFSSFDETTAEDFKNIYENLKKEGITSLIIDLRNNGGGIVNGALEIADYLLNKDDIILYEVDKFQNEKIEKSKKDPIINMPIVILTNNNTASASEILAGALKEHNKATIVGTKTYGKGVIQQILSLPDGSGLKITCEEYQTPNRTKINKIGIEPDFVVELPDTVKNILTVKEEEDTQLQKAIEILKK